MTDRDHPFALEQVKRRQHWVVDHKSEGQLLSEQVVIRVSTLNRSSLFECAPCGELLGWNAQAGGWVCPECDFVLSVSKQLEALELGIEFLKQVRKETNASNRRSWQWPWARWLNRQR